MSAAAVQAARGSARAGRARSEAADEAILAATIDLLAERGYGGLTVSAVIERAGVSSATLYRRWPTKQDVVVAALASLTPEATRSDTGSLAGDIAALLDSVVRSIAVRQESVAEGLTLEMKRNPELAQAIKDKFLEPRRQELDAIVDRAVARGELAGAPPAEFALSLVIGPVYHRAYVTDEPITPAFVAAATELVVGGLRAVGRSRAAEG